MEQVINTNEITKLRTNKVELPQDLGEESESQTDFFIIRTQRHSESEHIYSSMSTHQIKLSAHNSSINSSNIVAYINDEM